MYGIELENTDLSVLSQYLTDLKKRSALNKHRKKLNKVKRQLEAIFTVQNTKLPAIPWGY